MLSTWPGVRLKAMALRSVGTRLAVAGRAMPWSSSSPSRLSRASEIFCAAVDQALA